MWNADKIGTILISYKSLIVSLYPGWPICSFQYVKKHTIYGHSVHIIQEPEF